MLPGSMEVVGGGVTAVSSQPKDRETAPVTGAVGLRLLT